MEPEPGKSRRWGSSWTAGWLTVSLCALTCAPAAAQGAGDYRKFVDAGLDEFARGNFQEAYAMFERAHGVQPSARPLRGMALSLFELKRYVEAIRVIEQALAYGSGERGLPPDLQQSLYEYLERARAYVVKVQLAVEPADATIRLDGDAVEGGELAVDPGSHVLAVSSPGYTSEQVRFEALVGQAPSIHLVLEPEASGAATDVASAADPESEGESTGVRWLPWTLIGVGGAALIAGVATGLATNSAYDKVDEQCPGAGCRAAFEEHESSGKTLQTVTNALWIGGGVVAAAGVVLLVLGSSPDETETQSGASLRVVPLCARDGCLLTGTGRF